jgi:phosphoribosylformimino-5-aminoimidazole carboxamide ribotide isomerase
MSDWMVYPAIDMRGGRVVRLAQGDPGRETHYDDDPLAVAYRWQAAGASWLHVVNLDGAFGGAARENAEALLRILGLNCNVQFGGGLRTADDVRRVIELGVQRAVIGTAAVEGPELVEETIRRYGSERVAVSVDARHGMVRTHGWREGAGISVSTLAQRCADTGLRWLVYTDIARDGMGGGQDLAGATQLAQETGLQVIAAGGVSSLEHVHQAHAAGLAGVVIGRALYEGRVDLAAALQVGRSDAR